MMTWLRFWGVTLYLAWSAAQLAIAAMRRHAVPTLLVSFPGPWEDSHGEVWGLVELEPSEMRALTMRLAHEWLAGTSVYLKPGETP